MHAVLLVLEARRQTELSVAARSGSSNAGSHVISNTTMAMLKAWQTLDLTIMFINGVCKGSDVEEGATRRVPVKIDYRDSLLEAETSYSTLG